MAEQQAPSSIVWEKPHGLSPLGHGNLRRDLFCQSLVITRKDWLGCDQFGQFNLELVLSLTPWLTED
jgi:hypothetical protein